MELTEEALEQINTSLKKYGCKFRDVKPLKDDGARYTIIRSDGITASIELTADQIRDTDGPVTRIWKEKLKGKVAIRLAVDLVLLARDLNRKHPIR